MSCLHWYIYRPQRSCGQGNIFTPVCHSVHRGGSASMHVGIPPPLRIRPPRADTPLPREQTPPRPGTPPDQAPPQSRPPWTRHPPALPDHAPPPEADSSIQSTSGRYASYWNAFLLLNKIRRVTWYTSNIHTSKSDYFYIHLFALEAQIHIKRRN